MGKALDQTFRRYGATLQTDAAPYNPFDGSGDPTDDARYIVQPGVNFLRPWIAVRNGAAFQWPLGLEGFALTIDPELGIHKYIGGGVEVDVLNSGEEHFTLSGNFPGDSAPELIAALRTVIYADSTDEGKILFLPEILPYAQRVQVVHGEFSRDPDARGRDSQYSIEFVRLGNASPNPDATTVPTTPQPGAHAKGKTSHSIKVDSLHNTLRKIALWKLNSTSQWRIVYNANQAWFVKNNVPLAKAPDYRLPLGLKINY